MFNKQPLKTQSIDELRKEKLRGAWGKDPRTLAAVIQECSSNLLAEFIRDELCDEDRDEFYKIIKTHVQDNPLLDQQLKQFEPLMPFIMLSREERHLQYDNYKNQVPSIIPHALYDGIKITLEVKNAYLELDKILSPLFETVIAPSYT